MAQFQSNAAYDFELFEKKAQAKPVLNVVTNPKYKKRDRMSVVRVVTSVLIVVAAICVMLYSRAQLTALTADISETKTNYQQLVSENTRLRAELESKVSLRGIEESAKQLGLAKMQPYQVEYVSMEQEEEITLSGAGQEPTMTEKLELYIQSFLEYIKLR